MSPTQFVVAQVRINQRCEAARKARDRQPKVGSASQPVKHLQRCDHDDTAAALTFFLNFFEEPHISRNDRVSVVPTNDGTASIVPILACLAPRLDFGQLSFIGAPILQLRTKTYASPSLFHMPFFAH